MTSNYQQNFENGKPIWVQRENWVDSSYNNLQQSTIPAPNPGMQMQWNSSWPPPPAHCQFYPPPQMQSHWPAPLPMYEGCPNEFRTGQHRPFQSPYYASSSSSFENKFDNRRSFDNGVWYKCGSGMPHFEDEQDEPEEKTEREKNQEILNTFAAKYREKLGSVGEKESKEKMNICETRLKLKVCLELCNQLRAIHSHLSNSINLDELQWNAVAQQANAVKKHLESSLLPFTPSVLKNLETYVQTRRKKRDRIKRRKLMLSVEKQEKDQHTKQLHEKIDAWQEAIRQSHLAVEMEKKLKKDADGILSEVRKKCTEAKRMLELVKSVAKLRALKKQAAENKGLFTTSECDDHFALSVLKLEKLLGARLKEYAEEEKTLQVMLDEEHQVTRESAMKIRQQEHREKLEAARRERIFCLFGPEAAIHEMDPQYFHHEYYTPAERNLEALIQVRRSWDVWLVPPKTPGGESLPLTWVVPVKPSSKAWASYLDKVDQST